MRKGYSSQSVCVFVTTLAITYLFFFTSKTMCLRVLYGVFQICNMWLLLKMLCSKVLASFTDHCGLPCPLTSSQWTKEPGMASYQCKECIQLVILLQHD